MNNLFRKYLKQFCENSNGKLDYKDFKFEINSRWGCDGSIGDILYKNNFIFEYYRRHNTEWRTLTNDIMDFVDWMNDENIINFCCKLRKL